MVQFIRELFLSKFYDGPLVGQVSRFVGGICYGQIIRAFCPSPHEDRLDLRVCNVLSLCYMRPFFHSRDSVSLLCFTAFHSIPQGLQLLSYQVETSESLRIITSRPSPMFCVQTAFCISQRISYLQTGKQWMAITFFVWKDRWTILSLFRMRNLIT